MPTSIVSRSCRRWRARRWSRAVGHDHALLGQDRVREFARRHRLPAGCALEERRPGDGVGRRWPAHSGDLDRGQRHRARRRARAGRRRADGGGPADRGTQSRLPDHPEGARHRVPVRAPPPLAPQPAPGGDRAGAPRGGPGDPRLLLRAALSSLVDTPILTGAIGEAAATCSPTEYFDLGTAYSRRRGSSMSRPPLPRSGRCTASDPRFERRNRRPDAT